MSVRATVIRLSVFFFLCVACVLSQSYDSPAGVKIRTKEEAINEILKAKSSSVFANESQKTMPDESGTMKLSFLGDLDYKITNMQVTGLKPPEVKLTIRPDAISLCLTGTGFTLLGNWAYQHRWFGVSDSGALNISVNMPSVNVSLVVGFDSGAGRPMVMVIGCSVNVSSAAIRLSGGASWLYNLFTGPFAKSVESKVQTNVCAQVRRSIDAQVAAVIASQPLQRDLGDDLVVDMRLVSPPTFGYGYVECFHNGTVYDRNNPSMVSFQPGPFPEADESTKHLTLWVSEFVPRSYAYAMYSRGALRSTITQSTLPQSMRLFLNTTCPRDAACIGNLFPQIASKHPNSVLEASLAAVGPPMISISPSGLQAVTAVNQMVRARRADESLALVFNVAMNITAFGTIFLKDSEIKVGVSQIQPNVTSVTNSTVGTINTNDLSSMIDPLAKQYLQTEKTEKGCPIPDPKFIRLKDVELSMSHKCLLFKSNIEQSP